MLLYIHDVYITLLCNVEHNYTHLYFYQYIHIFYVGMNDMVQKIILRFGSLSRSDHFCNTIFIFNENLRSYTKHTCFLTSREKNV